MKRELGFTLFEIMMVLLLIAFVSGAVVVSVNSVSSSEDRVYQLGSQLLKKMQFASDEALIQQHLLGLRVENTADRPSEYSWHRYENERWQPLDEPLDTVTLPDDIDLSVRVDDELLETLLENTLNDLTEAENIPPAILFYPDSEISEFELTLTISEAANNTTDNKKDFYRIYLDERGQLSYALPGDD